MRVCGLSTLQKEVKAVSRHGYGTIEIKLEKLSLALF